MFLGREVPACGFSLGLERIIVIMTERDMFPAKVSRGAVDVMVTFLSDDLRADALRLASELRAEKLRVEIFPEGSPKLEKPLKYAAGRHVPVLAILGEDERARGEVAVRDLQTRAQENAPRATAAEWIAKRVRIAAP
jgi:histidyl-tRNA synthetase